LLSMGSAAKAYNGASDIRSSGFAAYPHEDIGTLGDINATDVGSRFGKRYDYQRLLGCANASMPGALVNLLLLLLATATARLAMIILCGAAWLHKQNMVFQQNVLH
jgi:hypothetical protein